MCARVTLSFILDDETILADAPTPVDLSDLGLELVDIEEEYLHDCWCCSDPLPTLVAAGFNVEYDEMFNEYFAEAEYLISKNYLPHKSHTPPKRTEDFSL